MMSSAEPAENYNSLYINTKGSVENLIDLAAKEKTSKLKITPVDPKRLKDAVLGFAYAVQICTAHGKTPDELEPSTVLENIVKQTMALEQQPAAQLALESMHHIIRRSGYALGWTRTANITMRAISLGQKNLSRSGLDCLSTETLGIKDSTEFNKSFRALNELYRSKFGEKYNAAVPQNQPEAA